MARRCELTGKEPVFGHNVSHSNRKTNRRFDPNLQKATFYSDALQCRVPLRVSTRVIRTVQKKGGLDAYLITTADAQLAPEGLRIKHKVKRALAGRGGKTTAGAGV